jgi:hypothetical protein
MWWTLGLKAFLLVQLPITLIAGSIGVYLFYVQHQYEDTYWRYREAWNYFAAGLEGASHLSTCGRRDARLVGGACRGLLRQGVRGELPRTAADDHGRGRARG